MSGDTVTINTVTDTSEPVAVYTAGATGTGSNVALQMSSSDESSIGYALYVGTDLVTSGTTTSSYEKEITDVPSGDLTVQIYADGTLPVSFTMLKFERSEAPEPPVPENYWSVNELAVTYSTQNHGSITIEGIEASAIGGVMAAHTEVITSGSNPTGVTAEFTVAGGEPFGPLNTETQIQLLVDGIVADSKTFEQSATVTLTAALSGATAITYNIVGASDIYTVLPLEITAVSTEFTY